MNYKVPYGYSPEDYGVLGTYPDANEHIQKHFVAQTEFGSYAARLRFGNVEYRLNIFSKT